MNLTLDIPAFSSVVEEIAARADFQHSRIGIQIRDTRSHTIFFQRNDKDLFPGASTTKLLTCASALHATGPATFAIDSTPVEFATNGYTPARAFWLRSSEDRWQARRFIPQNPTISALKVLVGSYYSPELGVTWKLRLEKGSIALENSRYLPSGAAGALKPQMRDAFTADIGLLFRFTRDRGGHVRGFQLSAGQGMRRVHFERTLTR